MEKRTTYTTYTTPAQPVVHATSMTVVNDQPPVVTQYRSSGRGTAGVSSNVTVVHQHSPVVQHHVSSL